MLTEIVIFFLNIYLTLQIFHRFDNFVVHEIILKTLYKVMVPIGKYILLMSLGC